MTFVDGRQHDFWRVDPARLRAALSVTSWHPCPLGDPSRVLAALPLVLFPRSQTPTVIEPRPCRNSDDSWRAAGWKEEQ